jgi:hypothetical protein
MSSICVLDLGESVCAYAFPCPGLAVSYLCCKTFILLDVDSYWLTICKKDFSYSQVSAGTLAKRSYHPQLKKKSD